MPAEVSGQLGIVPQMGFRAAKALVVREDWTSGTKKPDNVPSAKKAPVDQHASNLPLDSLMS